jgi:hypothetical protein
MRSLLLIMGLELGLGSSSTAQSADSSRAEVIVAWAFSDSSDHARVRLLTVKSEALLLRQSLPKHRSVAPYLVGGALVGMAAMSGGLWIAIERSHEDSLTPPLAFIPVVLGAGVVGAFGGWLVHRVIDH